VSDPSGRIGDHPLDDLAAYALAALDDAERQEVDDHLAGCASCRAELAEHHETLAALTTDEAPPVAVWQRVAASIGAPDTADPHTISPTPSPPTPGVAGSTADPETTRWNDPETAGYDATENRQAATGPGARNGRLADDTGGTVSSLAAAGRDRGRPGRPSQVRWLAAAACVAVALGAGGVVGYAVGSSGDDSTDIGGLAQQASEDPEGVVATLASTGGQPVARVVADEDGAYMVLEGLQDLPEGRAYQLWSLTGPQPVSLGMLGREGTNTVAFRLPPTITELAISVEPTSGESAPTGEFSASGTITRS
jgi:anti-sigma-K factor RskA